MGIQLTPVPLKLHKSKFRSKAPLKRGEARQSLAWGFLKNFIYSFLEEDILCINPPATLRVAIPP